MVTEFDRTILSLERDRADLQTKHDNSPWKEGARYRAQMAAVDHALIKARGDRARALLGH